MPRWGREPDADQRIKLAITGFKNGLYKSREDAAKSHGVDPNKLRRRLNGKHISHKVAHTIYSCATVYIPWKMLRDTFC